MRILLLALLCCLNTISLQAEKSSLPNILWLTSEDNGPHLGCYGDNYATTPHIDGLAAKGTVYLHAWSNAPVCAPARTTLISGMYPPSTGSEHMRSNTNLPAKFKMYPEYLRELGYYCTNNSKEDYNLGKSGKVWDESSRKAHWKNRGKDQPFFAIFNFTVSHESQVRKRPHTAVHDPAKVSIPAYHPDRPEVRRDWAQYHDKLTEMDAMVGAKLKELDEAGLSEETIVFYYGDHGAGMPRGKRWTYNSGLSVPMVVYIPEKFQKLATADYKPGGTSSRLVSFIDLPATLLSLAGKKPPAHFQGHAFLGKHATKPQPYIYGFRGRMDERYDLVRSVRNERYVYIRNYMPHKIYGQYIQYMFVTPTTQVWRNLYDAGKLTDAQKKFWEKKPAEELYDLQNDPDEIHNLAGSPEHQKIKAELRAAQQKLITEIRDIGFLPEQEIHTRSKNSSPYEMGHNPKKYPLEKIVATAELAASLEANDTPQLLKAFQDDDSAVRYWAAMGLLMREKAGVKVGRTELHKTLQDTAPSAAIIAAQALGQYGNEDDLAQALPVLMKYADAGMNDVFVAMLALNALDALDQRAASVKDQIAKLPRKAKVTPPRMNAYVGNLLSKTLKDLNN